MTRFDKAEFCFLSRASWERSSWPPGHYLPRCPLLTSPPLAQHMWKRRTQTSTILPAFGMGFSFHGAYWEFRGRQQNPGSAEAMCRDGDWLSSPLLQIHQLCHRANAREQQDAQHSQHSVPQAFQILSPSTSPTHINQQLCFCGTNALSKPTTTS